MRTGLRPRIDWASSRSGGAASISNGGSSRRGRTPPRRSNISDNWPRSTRGQQQLDRALNEALARVITRNVCSLVMERNNTYGWNNAMDITAAVTREMDILVQTVTIQ